jgi:hypothetical protein
MIRTRRSLLQPMLAACLLAAGCHTSSPQKQSDVPAAQSSSERLHTDPNTLTDPCAENLQNICEAMLLYYTTNKLLPAALPELQPYADAGTQLAFSCPVSGDPYDYVPAGLIGPGIHDRLVLYDAEPVHNGHRWAIVMSHGAPAQPVTLFVIPLSDSLLKAYLQSQK